LTVAKKEKKQEPVFVQFDVTYEDGTKSSRRKIDVAGLDKSEIEAHAKTEIMTQDRKIAEMMSSYWANFATTGDPNGKGLPHWPSVSEKPGMTMEVGDTTAPIRIAGDKAKEEFFTQYFSKSRPSQRP